ncbi:hypothetical protein A8709_14495 [Paenibacillus pectinilyticus]|uniref:GFO/IDH/MocA-like oxidoreductase domain-containing protein n=1 Tax=Paenibacillus pectinilyticus TaxID=512399 RepID=A0A1C1A410_9BACL|nr:Gfo/Idh/MocA family oxidoreductase [Paenibacillus pectinilyticus]OCT15302.1 hypothetical protein A8709_14495 [Paenibacillus pectinilyticus]
MAKIASQEHAFSGALGDLGIHKVDLLQWLLVDRFSEVGALCSTLHKPTNVDDHALLLLKTSNGNAGSLTASWTYYAKEINTTILFSEKGIVIIGTDPSFGVIVEYQDGSRECYDTTTIGN